MNTPIGKIINYTEFVNEINGKERGSVVAIKQ